jgi:hypothetical protein
MSEKLADELKRLCCAETEGKFFDCVTDNIDMILTALRAVDLPQSPAELTDEMIEAYLRSEGEWAEPFTAERESGVAVECDLSQTDADWINSDTAARLRRMYAALSAHTRPDRKSK